MCEVNFVIPSILTRNLCCFYPNLIFNVNDDNMCSFNAQVPRLTIAIEKWVTVEKCHIFLL